MGEPDDDDYNPDWDEEEDDGSECGAWFNGKFDYYSCTRAGTEYCDWDCPLADDGRRRRIAQMKAGGE